MKELIIIFLFFKVITTFGQVDTALISKKLKDLDILLVPYNTELYINYEEVYLTKANNINSDKINQTFRFSIDEYILTELNKYCKSESMMNTHTYNPDDELFILHSKSSYFYDKAHNIDKNYLLFGNEKSKLSDKNTNSQKGELVDKISNNRNKFLNVKFHDRKFLSNLSKQFKTDYFLIITQLELKGDYSNAYAVGSMTYKRRMKIHFALFNKNGKFITGSFSYADFSAKQNNIEEIINTNFPNIASDIVNKIALDL